MVYKILILLGGLAFLVYLLFPSNFDLLTGKPNWTKQIKNGNEALVVIDATGNKFDDSSYTGDPLTDPLGPVKGGEAYVLRYSKGSGYKTTGVNQVTGKVDTIISSEISGDPEKGELVILNQLFTFNEQGEIYHSDYGLIGHLNKVSLINRVKNIIGAIGPRWIKIEGDWRDNNCSYYCQEIGKNCASDSCPKGPPPCDCVGGTCEVGKSSKVFCAGNWDTDCRTLIQKDTKISNIYCCCR